MVHHALRQAVSEELADLKNKYDVILSSECAHFPGVKLSLEELLVTGRALSAFHKKFPVLTLSAEQSGDLEMIDPAESEVTAIKALLKRRQNSITASYGYFIQPYYFLNRSLLKITRALPSTSTGADIFKLLLPDYTITGVFDPVEQSGVAVQECQYGKVLYSEKLYRTKTGPVISIPHLMVQPLPILLAIFLLRSDEIAKLTRDTQSVFYQKTIIPLTNLEKACLGNFIYDQDYNDDDYELTYRYQRLFTSMQQWSQMRANVNSAEYTHFLALLNALADAIFMKKNPLILDAAKDLLTYWEIKGEKEANSFHTWISVIFVNDVTAGLRIWNLKADLAYFVKENDFETLKKSLPHIDKLRSYIANWSKSVDQLSLGSFARFDTISKRDAYFAYLQNKIFKLYQSINGQLSHDTSDESIFSAGDLSQCDLVFKVLLQRKTNERDSFPMVIMNAQAIGDALKQLSIDDYGAFFSAIYNPITFMIKTAHDFRILLDSVKAENPKDTKEKRKAVISKIIYCLEYFLNLHEKNAHQKQFTAFVQLARALSSKELKYVGSVLGSKLNVIFFSIKRFNLILENVTDSKKRAVLYYFRKSAMNCVNGADFFHMVQYLEKDLRSKAYEEYKKNDIKNIIQMMTPKRTPDSTEDDTVCVNYQGFMNGLRENRQERAAIIEALYQIITARFIPIYTALRAGQEGFMKNDFIKTLEKVSADSANQDALHVKKEKVEFLLNYISKYPESRSAIAWELACDFTLVAGDLFEKVRQVTIDRAYGGGLLLNLMHTLIMYAGSTVATIPASRAVMTEETSGVTVEVDSAHIVEMKVALQKVGQLRFGA